MAMTYDRAASVIVLALSALMSCARAPVSDRHAARQAAQWCTAVGGLVDSVLAVAQARRVFESDPFPLIPQSVERVVAVVGKDSLSSLRLTEGFLVRLMPLNRDALLGGGGLVWVNAVTACPILLIRYE
jgi:hypothetical protein